MKAVFLLGLLFVASALAKPSKQNPFGFRSGRIVNGVDAESGEFPYQISFQWGILGLYQHVCGGSIVSPTTVLTAGHCITGVPTIGTLKIIAGILLLSEGSSANRQDIEVLRSTVYPGYAGEVGPNDIAVLVLRSPLVFNAVVQPVNLPSPGAVTGGNAILSGWGAIEYITSPISPDRLQKVQIPVLSNAQCREALDLLVGGGDNPFNDDSNICTGPLVGGISACSGDSGGPLAQDNVVVGIVSWGLIPCGSDGAPSVYTKVSNFVDFIREHGTDLPN